MRLSLAAVCAAAFCAIAAQAVAETASASPALTVAQFKASPPVGKVAQIDGYVVDTYLCPPCPEGAMCKPCMSESSIFISDLPHAAGAADAPTIAIAVPDPAQFERDKLYRFEVTVVARAPEGVDGRLLRSQSPDHPTWTTPAPIP